MLTRTQVASMVEHGGELTNVIETLLSRREVLLTEEDEAFSVGRNADLRQLRKERETTEEETQKRWDEFSTVLRDLAVYATDCLRCYQQEVIAQGKIPAALSVPSSIEPGRVQACRRYFQDIEQAVNDVTSHLTAFRREQLHSAVKEIRSLLERLKLFGEELDTIEEYLAQEAYLELPLVDAQKRLRDEQTLVEHRLADCEREHQERERQEHLAQARAALNRLVSAETLGANTWEDDLNLAATLLQQGTSEDSHRFWRTVGNMLGTVTPAAQGQLIRLTKEALLERCLDLTTEEPPFELLNDMGSDALRTLDLGLATDSHQLSFPSAGDRSSDVADGLMIGRLCKLKECLPATSFEILQMTAEDMHFSTRDLATWFLSPPLHWLACGQAIEWLAHNLEKRGSWREAYACWGMANSEEAAQRRFAALLIAVAENRRLVPTSEEVWWTVLSTPPGVYASDITAAVATIVTLLLRHRVEFDLRELMRSCIGALDSSPQLRVTLELAVRAWPQPLSDFFGKVDACLREQKGLLEEVEDFLKTVKTPAGLPSRDFYRDILLPRLNETFQSGSAPALKELEPTLIRQLLEDHSRPGINPVAVQAMERLVRELQELGAHLVETEARLTQLSVSAGSSELIERLVDELEGLADQDPALRWACSKVEGIIRGTAPTSSKPDFIRFSPALLIAALFPNNPVVELAGNGAPEAEQLFIAFLEELRNEGNLADWRVRYAVECLAFDLADQYCKGAPLPDQSRFQEYISQSWSSARKDVADLLEIARQYVDNLEPSEDVDVARLYLEEAKIALERRDPRNAHKSIQAVVTEYERIEKVQREEREQIIAETRDVLARGFEQLCSKGASAPPELVPLLLAAVHAAHSSGPREAGKFGAAITSLLAGRAFDRSLVTAALTAPAPVELPALPEEAVQEAPGLTMPIPERSPIELNKLSQFVQTAIEGISQVKPAEAFDEHAAWHAMTMGASGPRRVRAAMELFRTERRANGRWEEPLVVFLEERGHDAWIEANYIHAAEYYLAATQVAYCAGARLDSGIEAARRTSLNYALVKLARLQASSGLKPTKTRPVLSVSPRDWVRVTREYLLLRGGTELTEGLETLLRMAPDLAPEYLELSLGEILALRPALSRALLDRLDTMEPSRYTLLEYVSICGLPADSRTAMVKFLSKFRDVVEWVAGGRLPTPGTPIARMFEDLAVEAEALPLEEQVGQLFREAIRRLRPGEELVSESSGVEASLTAITRELFLDAFEVAEDVPIHIRMSLTPPSAVLRGVTVSFRTEHPDLEVSPTCRALDLAWLRAGDPIELTCYVRRRLGRGDSIPHGVLSAREFVLEVSDVGIRQGGILKVGTVPYKGRRLTLQVRPKYPFPSRANPYSPGPAIKDLSLIKGRNEEVHAILSHLRGAFQDNVPLIWGPRRIGKSTLLYRLKLDPEVRRHYEAIVYDMEGQVQSNDTTLIFLERLTKRIHGELIGTPAGRVPIPDIGSAAAPLDAFQDYLDKLADSCGNKALLLMFDEMDLFFDILHKQRESEAYGRYESALHEDIVHLLRHNMQHNRRMSFIMAGTKRLLDIASEAGERLFQLPIPIEVGELQATAANALISEPVGDTFVYSSAAKEKLLWLTARHPYLLQGICHEVFSFMQDQRLSICSTTELDQAIHTRVFKQLTYFEFQVRPLINSPEKLLVARTVAELTQEERHTDPTAVQARIELQNDMLPVPDVTAELRALGDTGILAESRGEYRFRFPIVGLYVSKTMGDELR